MFNRKFTEFFGGTKRIKQYELKEALDKLDNAYFALETDEKTLEISGRPLINNPEAAQELIFEAMQIIENLEDYGMVNLDHMVWDMKNSMDNFKTLKLEVDVVKDKYD